MGVGEADAPMGKALHGGCVELRLIGIPRPVLVGTRVAHPHVIGEKEDDVRLRRIERHADEGE